MNKVKAKFKPIVKNIFTLKFHSKLYIQSIDDPPPSIFQYCDSSLKFFKQMRSQNCLLQRLNQLIMEIVLQPQHDSFAAKGNWLHFHGQ